MRNWNVDTNFVGCISNQDYEVSLELWKYYRVLRDEKASSHGYLRIIDESGEDYLYPQHYFSQVEMVRDLRRSPLESILSGNSANTPTHTVSKLHAATQIQYG